MQQRNSSNSVHRNQSVDLAKIIAMVGVIMLHTFSTDFFYYLSVIAIPLFFMSLGYIQLGKEKVNLKYCALKIWHILRFVVLFTLFVAIFNSIISPDFSVSVQDLPEYILGSLIQKGGYGIFWFFGALIILYAFMPLINKLYLSSAGWFNILTILLILIMNIVFIEDILHLRYGWKSEQEISQTFRLYNWFGYLCLGGLIKRYKFNFIGSRYLLILLLPLIYLFQLRYIPYIGSMCCEYYYSSLPVTFFVSVIFILCLKIKINNSKIISSLSTLFLPVYSLHLLILIYTFPVLYKLELSAGPYNVYLFLIVLSVSLGLSGLLMKIPVLKKFFSI